MLSLSRQEIEMRETNRNYNDLMSDLTQVSFAKDAANSFEDACSTIYSPITDTWDFLDTVANMSDVAEGQTEDNVALIKVTNKKLKKQKSNWRVYQRCSIKLPTMYGIEDKISHTYKKDTLRVTFEFERHVYRSGEKFWWKIKVREGWASETKYDFNFDYKKKKADFDYEYDDFRQHPYGVVFSQNLPNGRGSKLWEKFAAMFDYDVLKAIKECMQEIEVTWNEICDSIDMAYNELKENENLFSYVEEDVDYQMNKEVDISKKQKWIADKGQELINSGRAVVH